MIFGLQNAIDLTKIVLKLSNLKNKFGPSTNFYGGPPVRLCKNECVGVDNYIKKIAEFVQNNRKKFPNEMSEIDIALRNIKVLQDNHVCFNFYQVVRIDQVLKLLQYKNLKRKIFISHAEKDKDIIKNFVALFSKFGLTKDHVFCSSVEGYNIPIGSGDIYEYLLKEYTGNELLVLMFLSKNYYESSACLNEMGAAWIRKDKYQSILMPNFDFPDMKGTINPRDISFKLDDLELRESRMDELKNLIFNYLELPLPDEKSWIEQRDIFLKSLDKEAVLGETV